MDGYSVVHDALVLDRRACACGNDHNLDVDACGNGCGVVLCDRDARESDRDGFYVLGQALTCRVLLQEGDQQELLFS